MYSDPPPTGDCRLVGADRAIVDSRKLVGYALDPGHPVGHHKARAFASILGFDRANYRDLADQLRRGLMNYPPTSRAVDRYGERYTVDIPIHGPRGRAVVRTVWIYDPGSRVPRLVTLFVRRRR
jgi:filamentous hemagglutinin